MNSLALARKIRNLSEEWRGLLSSPPGDAHVATSLQGISDGLSQSADELEKLSSWDLPTEDAAGVFGSQIGLTAAALQQTTLSDDGLLGTVAAAALQKEAAHVALKTQALVLCQLTLSAGCGSAILAGPQALEELVETCMGIFAVDSSLKVKRAALRLLKVAVVPESGAAELGWKQRRFFPNKPALGVPVREKILLRLSVELSQRGRKLGTTVRSELYVVIAALLKSFRSYPLLTLQWQPQLLQQIVLHLQTAKHLPRTGQVETLGALEALREVLIGDKTAGRLLPTDSWRGVYAYVVTVGTQGEGGPLVPEEAAGKMSAATAAGAASRSLQQAALAVLQEGAESFVSFLDRDIAAEFAGSSLPSKLPAAEAASGYCVGPIKGARSSRTLLDRLLSLTASLNAGIAYTASRVLSRVVGALCAARPRASGDDAGLARLARLGEGKEQAEAEEGSASSASATRDAREAQREGTSLEEGRLACDAALQSFSAGVVADLQRDSALSQALQVQQPEGWWQQCGCRGFVAYRSLSLFSGEDFRFHGTRAAAACLRLAAAGCGSAWQQQHGPSCNKQALHLLGAAGAILCSLLQGARLQGSGLASSQGVPQHVKRRRLSASKHQEPAADVRTTKSSQASLLLLGEQAKQLRGCVEGGVSNGGVAESLLKTLFTQLRRVSLALFELHAKAGALPRSLVPKAAAAVGRAARALIVGAAAEGLAVVAIDEEAAGVASGARPSKGQLGDVGELEDAEAGGGPEASEDAVDAEGPQAEDEEGLDAGQAAGSALRRLIRESLSLALADHAVQPPTFVSVALLWKSVLVGDGQGDSLRMDLGDDAYRNLFRPARLDSSKGSNKEEGERTSSPREQLPGVSSGAASLSSPISSWQVHLSEVLLGEIRSSLAAGVEVQTALQRGASTGIGAFAQTLFESAEDEKEVEATETVLLQGRPTLAASCFITAALTDCQTLGAAAGVDHPSVEADERAAMADGLVAYATGVVSARSEAQLLQRISGCFCHILSDAATRRLFFSASWMADFATLLQDAIATLSPGPGALAMLQAAKPLIDEWRGRINDCATGNYSNRVNRTPSVASPGQEASEPGGEGKLSSAGCCVSCQSGEGKNPFAAAEEAISRLLMTVASATLSLPAEEAAAAVALLLAAPDSFLFAHPHLFKKTIQRAFRLGRAHLPLACAAVSALRRWLRQQQQTSQKEDLLLRSVLPLVRPFIVASAEKMGHSGTAAHTAFLHEAAQAGFTESELRLVVSRLKATSGLQEVLDDSSSLSDAWSPHVVSIRRSCLELLGDLGPRRALWMLGGSRDLSLSGLLALQSCEDRGLSGSGGVPSEMFLRTSLPLGSAPGSAVVCFPVKSFIVNVAKAAVEALSRQARATFCELLAALVCAVSQEAEACIRTQSEGGFAAVPVPHAKVSEREGEAAAAALAALYKAILPFFLELLASPDPVPSQLLSPVMLRCLWTSVDAALLPTLKPDPRIEAVLEVLTKGLGEDCGSRRSAAASGFGALISRVLRRLDRREGSAAVSDATAALEASSSAHGPMGASEAQRELLLLKRILQQGVLLPLSYGGPAQRLGGLAVLSAVLPLGALACRCTAARGAFLEFAFKCLIRLLSGLQEGREEKEEDVKASSNYRCSWCPPTPCAQGNCPNEVVDLQCLQGVAATGQFLIRRFRAECREAVEASSKLTTVTQGVFGGQQATRKDTRTHRLLDQAESLFKHLRRFALDSNDRGIRDVCRSLLSHLASTGLAVGEQPVTTAQAAGARTSKDWTATAVAGLRSKLEDLLAGRKHACSRIFLSEAFARKLLRVLDSLCWLAQQSAKAYESVAEDSRMLNCICRALEVVWLEEGNLSHVASSEIHVLLAEASLRLCFLVRPPRYAEAEGTEGASAPRAGRLLLYCISERSAQTEDAFTVCSASALPMSVTGASLQEAKAKRTAQLKAKSALLWRGSLMSSLIRFLLNPAAFGFALASYSSLHELRRLAVCILKAFAHEDLTSVPASASGGGANGGDVQKVRALLKEWTRARQEESHPMKREDLEGAESALTTSVCRVWGPLVRAINFDFISLLVAPFSAVQLQVCEQQPMPWIPTLALQAYIEALEAFEKVYGRDCLFADAEKEKLLLTSTSPADAASAAVVAAASVLEKVRRHSLMGQTDPRIKHDKWSAEHTAWQQIVVLLLRVGLLFTRCAATSNEVEDGAAAQFAHESASGMQGACPRLQQAAKTFLFVSSFPVTLLVPAVYEVASGADQGIVLSFLSTSKMLRREIFACELTRCPAQFVHLLNVLAALIRRQTKAKSAPASPRMISAAVSALAGGVLLDEDSEAREEDLLLQVILYTFELCQSSGVCGDIAQEHPEGAAAGKTLSLPRQQAALADLLVAASSWRMLLEALPYRDGALRFIASVTSNFLSGAIATPPQVRARALRGAFLVVLLADLLHEVAAEKHRCLAAAKNREETASSSRPPLQQRQSREEDEDRAIEARRATLAAALRSCSEAVSAMVAEVFPLVSSDLRSKKRARGSLADERSALSRRDSSSSQASADARKYAVLLRSLLDLTLIAFSAAAECEAQSPDAAGTGAFPTESRTVSTIAEQGAAKRTRGEGDADPGSEAGDEQGAPLSDYSRVFKSLKLCLTHLHDTLREEQHCFHQRIRRFLSSLVSICSQAKCHRLRLFVISHCFGLLLADVPRQCLPVSPQQGVDAPLSRGSAVASLNRPLLGVRMLEVVTLPILYKAGRAHSAGSQREFYCQVWRLLWERAGQLLSPQWENVIPIFRRLRPPATGEEVAFTSAVRRLQVFASVCGAFEILFCVTPLNVFRSAVAPLLLASERSSAVSGAAAAHTASSRTPAPPAGAVVTRRIIAAMSYAMRAFEDASVSVSHYHRAQRQEAKQAHPDSGRGTNASLLDLLCAWLWKGRVRSYGCLSAAVCSTQSNASLYESLLTGDAAGLLHLVDGELLSFSQRMRLHGDTALSLWPPLIHQGRQEQRASLDAYSFAYFSVGHEEQQDDRKWAGSQQSLRTTTANATLSTLGSTLWTVPSSHRFAGLEGKRRLFAELSQSIARGIGGEQLLTKFVRDPTIQRIYAPSQHFQPNSTLGKRWLQSLSSAPSISSAFAAAEWNRVAAAAMAPSRSNGEAATSAQERVEATLCGRVDETDALLHDVAQYNDPIGRSAVSQLLLRVLDCASIRFGSEWGLAASTAVAQQNFEETSLGASSSSNLPAVIQALLNHCNSSASTLTAFQAEEASGDLEEDRAWAFRLVLLRLFAQRADLLFPLADKGLLDFVAESVVDRRLLRAKRLHYLLRDLALLIVRWIQMPHLDEEQAAGNLDSSAAHALPPPLRPLTAAKLAAFAESLIRLCTCRDARTHKLNIELVRTLLERLHCRLSGIESSGGLPRQPAASQGIPFLQLSLSSFFVYESLRSVEETARFRLSGVAVVRSLCELERRQRNFLLVDGGPYSKTLCNRNLFLAASRALLFPSAPVAIESAALCGLLLSDVPREPLMLGKADSRRPPQRSGGERTDLVSLGHSFLNACHRRLQHLSAAEVAANNGNPPTLCGSITLGARSSDREGGSLGAQEQQHSEGDPLVSGEVARDKEEELKIKSMLYSFNYDGRFAEVAAALAREQPLVFFGEPGSVPGKTFQSLLSHLAMLCFQQPTRAASQQAKRDRKCVASLEAIQSVCCCDVAEEAARAPGCAALCVTFGVAAAATGRQGGDRELTTAQEQLDEWQRRFMDSALEALEPLWESLLTQQRAASVLLSALSLLRSLLERWGHLDRLLGAIQAMAAFLKKPPSDGAVTAALFEVCAWLRGHSQEYADSPSLLAFMLGPLPNHLELRQRQLDYWFGDDAALPKDSPERISFLLSAGLSEVSAPRMLQLLTAAVCHQQRGQEQRGHLKESETSRYARGTQAGSPRPLAALAYLVLRDAGAAGRPAPSRQKSYAKQYAASASISTGAKRSQIWRGATQLRGLTGSQSLSLRGANTLVLSSGQQASLYPGFWGRRPQRQPAQASPVASESSSTDELEEQGEGLADEFLSLSRGGVERGMSRATGVAIYERRRRRMIALLRKHQNALAGKEEAVELVRDCYSLGNPSQFSVSPLGMLQLVGEASKLNATLAADFLLSTVPAHLVLPRERRTPQDASRGSHNSECDSLGLVTAGCQVLETCCANRGDSTNLRLDRSFLTFLQRLVLQAFVHKNKPLKDAIICSPMHLYELARSTETLEVALPLMEEMTCKQQEHSLSAVSRQQSAAQRQEANRKAASSLRLCLSALYLAYGDLGQRGWQRSALQLLALHGCFKAETTNSLLDSLCDTDRSGMRLKPAEALGEDAADVCDISQQHDESADGTWLAKRLIRDAHLQSLQRMMQWKSLVDSYGPRPSAAFQGAHDSGTTATTLIQRARGTADLKQLVELGGGCLVRAALALSLSGESDASSEDLLKRLIRLLSPAHFLRAHESDEVAEEGFGTAIPAPLKISLCQILSLHAVSKGLLLDASLLGAGAASELQDLVSEIAAVPSSLFLSTMARASLSLLLDQGLAAMQHSQKNTSQADYAGSARADLQSFLIEEIEGGMRPSPREGRRRAEIPKPLFSRHIEAAPFSGCLDALFGALTFIDAMERQQQERRLVEDSDVGHTTKAVGSQGLLLPVHLRCAAVSHASRQLIKEREGIRAATVLLQDMLQRQQQQQQQQLDVKLFGTVIRLRLRELRSQFTASSSAIAKAQQLLRTVQREASRWVTAGGGSQSNPEEDRIKDKSFLLALQLSCHCAVLQQLQRPTGVTGPCSSKELNTASSEALNFLFTATKQLENPCIPPLDEPAIEAVSLETTLSPQRFKAREKCLWKCAALAKETLSSLQEVGDTSAQDRSGSMSSGPIHGGVGDSRSSVGRLFCDIVVDLVASSGSTSKYGKRGAALIPSVLLLCAEASRPSSLHIQSRLKGEITKEEGMQAEALRSSEHLANKRSGMSEAHAAAESVDELETRVTRLFAKIPVESLGTYFPQLLSFLSADESGCLTRALLPRLHEVIAADPHRAFYFIQTAASAAFFAEASYPQGSRGHAEERVEGKALAAAVSLLDVLRVEALRRAPIASPFAAACELLQPPERRMRQQLLEPLLEVLSAAAAKDQFGSHMQSEQRLPPPAATKWRSVWMSACNSAVIGEYHAVLGEAVDLRTKKFAANMKEVVCSFLLAHPAGRRWNLRAGPLSHPFAECAVEAMLELPVSELMGLLRILSREASRVATVVDDERGLELSQVSPWLWRFTSEEIPGHSGPNDAFIAQARYRFPVPFSAASTLPETPEIISFCKRVVALPSKQKPMRLSFFASDGYCYSVLVKGGEDLRLDQRIQTLMRILTQLDPSKTLAGDSTLRLRPYGVLSMSETHGLVEWIACTSPLVSVCETYSRSPLGSSPACIHYARFLSDVISAVGGEGGREGNKSATIVEVWSRIFELPPESVERVYQECVELATTRTSSLRTRAEGSSHWGCSNCSLLAAPPVPPARTVLQCLTGISDTFEELAEARKRFSASLAASAAICYCLGVGDRHLGNCLLDLRTGECINIDFGYAFDVAVHDLPVPELAPLRLSPCLLHVVGPPGARDLALLHSTFFDHLSTGDKASPRGSALGSVSFSAVPSHAWVAGSLGLFETCFADALDFVRNQRLVVEAVVEMFVKEPFAAYSKASRQKAALWKLEEASEATSPPLQASQSAETAPSQSLHSAVARERTPQATAVPERLETEFTSPSLLAHTKPQGVREAEEDEEAARRTLAFVKRKLRGEHPSLILLDLLRSHCEVNYLAERP